MPGLLKLSKYSARLRLAVLSVFVLFRPLMTARKRLPRLHPERMPAISRRLRPKADTAGSGERQSNPTPEGVAARWHPFRV